jgi:hypothetical protein
MPWRSVCELTVLSCIDATDDGCDAVGVLSRHNELIIYTSSICWSKHLLHQIIISWVAYVQHCIYPIWFQCSDLNASVLTWIENSGKHGRWSISQRYFKIIITLGYFIVLIHKEGDKANYNNHHGISPLSTLYKTVLNIALSRLSP